MTDYTVYNNNNIKCIFFIWIIIYKVVYNLFKLFIIILYEYEYLLLCSY